MDDLDDSDGYDWFIILNIRKTDVTIQNKNKNRKTGQWKTDGCNLFGLQAAQYAV